jgi:hypothetical protein
MNSTIINAQQPDIIILIQRGVNVLTGKMRVTSKAIVGHAVLCIPDTHEIQIMRDDPVECSTPKRIPSITYCIYVLKSTEATKHTTNWFQSA